jgi:hypothetical protein
VKLVTLILVLAGTVKRLYPYRNFKRVSIRVALQQLTYSPERLDEVTTMLQKEKLQSLESLGLTADGVPDEFTEEEQKRKEEEEGRKSKEEERERKGRKEAAAPAPAKDKTPDVSRRNKTTHEVTQWITKLLGHPVNIPLDLKTGVPFIEVINKMRPKTIRKFETEPKTPFAQVANFK